MSLSDQDLIDGIERRDERIVSRLISYVEESPDRIRPLLSRLYARKHQSVVIGVTGAPGAGKSTLVDQLAQTYRKEGRSVAVLAVDPSSPFTGGALLGDRIRMTKSLEDPEVFVRSLASRGSLGGLSRAAFDAVTVLQAAGFERIVIETVGVGQGEVDVMQVAETCLVVLVPGMGDSVQSMKAGLLEIADVFVINKADREGADLVQRDLRSLISLASYGEEDWKPEIVRTIATTGEGVSELVAKVDQHQQWFTQSPGGRGRRDRMVRERIARTAVEMFQELLSGKGASALDQAAQGAVAGTLDPYQAAQQAVTSAAAALLDKI